MKNLCLIFLLTVSYASFSQNEAIIIWCSTESSITYPIVISNDSITEKFSAEHIKYRNRISIKKKKLYEIILKDKIKKDLLLKIFNIIETSYNDLSLFEDDNEYLSYPEIRYIKNGNIVKKLVIESKEKFKELMERLKPFLKKEFSESNYVKWCNYLNAIYADVAIKYYEIKTQDDKR